MFITPNGFQAMLGKTIQAVVTSESRSTGPADQLFLVFADNTYIEFYGDVIHAVDHVYSGGQAELIAQAQASHRQVRVCSSDSDIRQVIE